SEARAAGLGCGSAARLRYLRAGKEAVLLDAVRTADGDLPGCPATGEQRVAVILMHQNSGPVPITPASYWQQRIFGDPEVSLPAFVAASSGGRTSVNGQVFGWYEAPTAFACTDIIPVKELALAAASNDVDFRSFNRVLLIVEPKPGEICGAAGFGQIGCIHQSTPQGFHTFSISWLFARNLAEPEPISPPLPTVIHEFGHNLGLHHARALNFPGEVLGVNPATGTRIEYGDAYSTMGGEGDFSARHKALLGWLDSGDGVQSVSSSGVYTLSRLQSPGPGPRALRVRRRPDSLEWIWLEARTRTHWERPASAPAFEDVTAGIFLHYQDEADVVGARYTDRLTTDVAPENSRIHRPKLKPGEVWRDGHSSLRIEVLGQSEAETRVRVDYESLCAVTAVPGSTVPAAGGTFTVSVQAAGDCAWNVAGDSHFVIASGPSERSGPGVAEFVFEQNHDVLPRTAKLTIGRQVFQITQAGNDASPQVTNVDLLTLGVDFGAYAGYQVVLHEPNGAQNLKTLEMRIGTSVAQPVCMATVNFLEQRVLVYGIDNTTVISSFSLYNPAEVPGSFCDFGLIGWQADDYRDNRPELAVAFQFKPLTIAAGIKSVAAAIYVRVTDRDGNQTAWQRFRPFSIGEECIVRTAGSRVVVNEAERTLSLSVLAPQGCLWSAYSLHQGLEIDPVWRGGSSPVVLKIAAGSGLQPTVPFEVGTQPKLLVRVIGPEGAPVVASSDSIVDGASFRKTVAAGSWFSIFGERLALLSRSWQGEDFHAHYLPPGLDAVEVLVDGNPVPVSFSGSGQLNALMPAGKAGTTAEVAVRTPMGQSTPHPVTVEAIAPSLFSVEFAGMKIAASHHPDGVAVGPFPHEVGEPQARPAQPGDVISVYGTGFGPVASAIPEDQLFQGAEPLVDPSAVSVTLGGVPCPVQFIGKTAAGLYQMNIQVPALAPGNHKLLLRNGHELSQDGVLVPVSH
ncbi:MAG: hypothetical protein KIT83_20895, partial [Bryobacterales bacterium]|nr:hypothetical protein [Bryobacterales bacterium]